MGFLSSVAKEFRRAGRKIEDEVKRVDVKSAAKALANPTLAAGKAQVDVAGRAITDALVPDMPEVADIPELVEKAPKLEREGAQAAEAERKRLQRRKGRASTILTSSQGLLKPANVGTRTLLG